MGEGRERKLETKAGPFPDTRCIIRDNQTDESKIKKHWGCAGGAVVPMRGKRVHQSSPSEPVAGW